MVENESIQDHTGPYASIQDHTRPYGSIRVLTGMSSDSPIDQEALCLKTKHESTGPGIAQPQLAI